MKLISVLATAMAILPSSAIATAEETQLPHIVPEVCVKIRVCLNYDFKGPCYNECQKPSVTHKIRDGFRDNAGSFAVDTKGYLCTVGTPNAATCSGKEYPGFKRLPDWCVNNISGYHCTKS
ncbi:hypothetical protein P168DRAFT_345379 [Aspergillus campestris IBT 28561]|uniref:Uncharacterized protein n=1 Tax=Aspergillus campestris (strain IBT 28561) TaxID=1392248 RepID=A0A2I1CZA6_ASPC2|nr:uncharacterized protein P168DRAFT_345379 [Aspergillus campestris IBT 28561]PKY02954.1 hypothetical protein P168DRAFT_345379 [Aspergillus campestris IBT 28561]